MENELTLAEKLLLLAVRPEKGGLMWVSSHSLDFTLIGATLLDMELSGHVLLTDKRVAVVKEISQNPLHAYFLEKMARSVRPRRIRYWMEPFAISGRRMRKELYQLLAQKNEIRLEDRRFLFFTWKKAFLTGSNHTWQLISHIKDNVYQFPDNPKDIYLLVIMETAELWRRIYPDWRKRISVRKTIRENLDKIQPSGELARTAETIKTIRNVIRSSVAASRAAAS
jgi:hypothetical protein